MDDWKVPCSDDELAGDGNYEPLETDVIIELYEAIQRGEIPLFETKIYPRKEPASEKAASPETESTAEQTPEKEKTPVEPTEFDFDTQPEDNVKRFTPRRTPNRPMTKKVARMENVYSDIMKYGKMEDSKKKEEEPQAN